MATNLDVITSALRSIGVIAETEPVSSEQGAHALTVLSDMLLTWQAEGIVANVVPQTDTAAMFPLEADRVMGSKAYLAVLLAPTYGRDAPLTVQLIADAQYRRFLGESMALTMPEKRMNLPAGTGQVWGDSLDFA